MSEGSKVFLALRRPARPPELISLVMLLPSESNMLMVGEALGFPLLEAVLFPAEIALTWVPITSGVWFPRSTVIKPPMPFST